MESEQMMDSKKCVRLRVKLETDGVAVDME